MGGRQRKEEKHREEREKEAKVSISPGGFFQSTDVGTLFRAGPGAESVCQQHALSPLCPRDLCQERGPAYEVRHVGPFHQIWVIFCGIIWTASLSGQDVLM